jgi:hypothetical protein
MSNCPIYPLRLACSSLILLLPRDHPSHPAPRILHITIPPWNEMDMDVEHRLPGRGPDIHPDIEPGDRLIFDQ